MTENQAEDNRITIHVNLPDADLTKPAIVAAYDGFFGVTETDTGTEFEFSFLHASAVQDFGPLTVHNDGQYWSFPIGPARLLPFWVAFIKSLMAKGY